MLSELLNVIDNYLVGRSTVDNLETWLVSNLQHILDSGDSAIISLANRVDADIIEFGEQLIDELQLRERLDTYLKTHSTLAVEFSETERTTKDLATTASDTINDQLVVPGLVENRPVRWQFV